MTGYDHGGSVLVGWSVEGGDDRGIRFEPEIRERIAKIILRARDKDLEAAAHIENALATLRR